MSNFTLTENTQRGVAQATINFISWSPYPQIRNRKTELINRIGSTETITQTLYESSTPTGGMAVTYVNEVSPASIKALQATLNGMVGVESTLTDNLNTMSYEKLVITDLTTRIKKANMGWLLIAEFSQHIRK
jgi:hypothetical protein